MENPDGLAKMMGAPDWYKKEYSRGGDNIKEVITKKCTQTSQFGFKISIEEMDWLKNNAPNSAPLCQPALE